MLRCSESPLACESIQSPEHEDVKAALRGVGYHLSKLRAVGRTSRLIVLILDYDSPALRFAKFPKLNDLIGDLLALVLG